MRRREQSNTSSRSATGCCSSCSAGWRRASNPDLEVGRFLTERAGSSTSPPLLGALEYRRAAGRSRHARRAARLRAQRGRRLGATRSTRLERFFEGALAGGAGRRVPTACPPAGAARAGRRRAAGRRHGAHRPLPRVGAAARRSAPPSCTWRWPPSATTRRSRPSRSRRSTSARCTSRCAAARARRCPALRRGAGTVPAARRRAARAEDEVLDRFQAAACGREP